MKIPDVVRRDLRSKLWSIATELDWCRLSWQERTRHYETWTMDSDIGGLLSNYMDQQRIRVYIKDTLLKGYGPSRQASSSVAFRALGISPRVDVAEEYDQPHGQRLSDGRVIAWGRASDWKLVLAAVHERTYRAHGVRRYAAVLLSANGKYHQPQVREMVQNAADRLGIERLRWLS